MINCDTITWKEFVNLYFTGQIINIDGFVTIPIKSYKYDKKYCNISIEFYWKEKYLIKVKNRNGKIIHKKSVIKLDGIPLQNFLHICGKHLK